MGFERFWTVTNFNEPEVNTFAKEIIRKETVAGIEWIDGVTDNFGFLVKYEGSTIWRGLDATTHEGITPALHPQLVIEYTVP